MNTDLFDDNPEDFHRRTRQISVLKWLPQSWRVSFGQKTEGFERDDACDSDTDDISDPSKDIDNTVIFASWRPKEASKIGFLSDEEVFDRFNIENTKSLLLGVRASVRGALVHSRSRIR